MFVSDFAGGEDWWEPPTEWWEVWPAGTVNLLAVRHIARDPEEKLFR